MILGLDLSSSCTGFGILDDKGVVVEYGQIKPTADMSHGAKYHFICEKVCSLLKEYPIEEVVLEMYFVGGFKSQGTFICAEVRGAVKASIAANFPDVTLTKEIFPSTLKKTVAGSGRATKREVCEAILAKLNVKYDEILGTKKCRFKIDGITYYDDVGDALSLAYCHYLKGA